MPRTYRVKDVWRTLQGEGAFAGRPAVFVRFVACNLWTGRDADRARDADRSGADCPLWCDTDFTREGSRVFDTPGALADHVATVGGGIGFVVCTGGEPLLQLDAPLVAALHARGLYVAVETNGTVSLASAIGASGGPDVPDWVTCSPKLRERAGAGGAGEASPLALEWFDEIKLVVPDYAPADVAAFLARQRVHTVAGAPLPLRWLQPEDGPRVAEATAAAVAAALADPSWRVSVQTHKVLDVP